MSILKLTTSALKSLPEGGRVARILNAALQAVEPGAAVARFLRREGDILWIDDRAYDLGSFEQVILVGCGKAGAPMARAVQQILGDRLTQGIVIVKDGHTEIHDGQQLQDLEHSDRIQFFEASHPLPDLRGVSGTRRILDLLHSAGSGDLVIGVISGGGSALLTAPAPGLTLGDLQALTAALLACGANINEINCLRKHLDIVKGGGLARAASRATVVTMILSDVIGDPVEVIASGPMAPDSTTFSEALKVLDHYQVYAHIPVTVVETLQRGVAGDIPETPKPGDPVFERVQTVIVGSNLQAAEAALEQAQFEGFHTMLLTTYLQGEARQAGSMLAAIARQIAANGQPVKRPACIVAGGETTVTLTSAVEARGMGGRNQELALSAVKDLAGLARVALITLATDGGDGPTDAAGAVVTGESLAKAHTFGLDPDDFLARNDAYTFFVALGDLIKPGPTQTNVNDLAFLFAF